MADDSRQQTRQLFPLRIAERRAQIVLKLLRYLADAGQNLPAGAREVQPVTAPIRRVVPPLNELTILELIEQHNEPAWKHSEQVAQLLLAESRVRAEHPKEPCVMGL